MRRIALALATTLALALVGSAAHAQSIGIRAGGHLSNIVGADVDNTTMRPGFHVGAFTSLSAGPIALRPELLYTVQGANLDLGDLSTEDASVRLSYLQVPVFAKFDLLPGPIAPYIAAGPYAQLLLGANSVVGDAEDDVKDAYAPYTFGIAGAVGAGFQTPIGGLSAELRYTRDLVDMRDSEVEGESQFNSVIALSVGLQF